MQNKDIKVILKRIRETINTEHRNAFALFFANMKGFIGRIGNKQEYWGELDSTDLQLTSHNLNWLKDWSLSDKNMSEITYTLRTQSAKLKFRSDFIVAIGAFLSFWLFAFSDGELKSIIALTMTLALTDRVFILQKIYENDVICELLKIEM